MPRAHSFARPFLVPFLLFAAATAGQPSTTLAADEDPPEIKALASRLKADLKSTKSATRITAYEAIGELGPKAKSLRRTLVEGYLDRTPMVQMAASDALKKVDERIHKLSLGISINSSLNDVVAAWKLGSDADALIPLIARMAEQQAPIATKEVYSGTTPARLNLRACVEAMVVINPDDPVVNTSVISLISNPNPHLRHIGVDNIRTLKNRKLALTRVIQLAGSNADLQTTRIGAIGAIPVCVDENTKEKGKKALESMRFDQNPDIRSAVDSALKSLK